MSLNRTHKALIRENLRKTDTPTSPRNKRRRTRARSPSPVKTIEIDSESTDDFADVDLEDVDLDAVAINSPIPTEVKPTQDRVNVDLLSKSPVCDFSLDLGVDSEDFDDLEDVDMEIFNEAHDSGNKSSETLTFSINNGAKETAETKKKKNFVPILKHERKNRKLVHKLVLFSMVCHGAVRNKWCNQETLLETLRKTVSAEIVSLFDQENSDALSVVKAKRFIDGLRKLLTIFARKFKVTSPGIQRKGWENTDDLSQERNKAVTFETFMKCVKTLHGSRDIGAQAFVAVLRSIGVNARLVFSVQVPDFRSIRPVKDEAKENKHREKLTEESSKPKSEFDPVFIPNPRQALLSGIRSRKTKATENTLLKIKLGYSKFPVFWIEAWNPYSKKWITVDPIVFNVVEVVPMRRKCKFDSPGTDETHQTWYVLAYDKRGTIKDVTRRYTQYYNAKTAKRRIGFASQEDEHWYTRILRSVSKLKTFITQAEAIELKEFHDRNVCEGIPNNMADFKNHPVYALEPQLRQDEIIYPTGESSKCGTFRPSNKSSIMPVYRRSCVHKLKTPKAWHMCGRILKVGARPLKTKKPQVQITDEEGDDDGIVRLYAEFQTDLYIPPPIVDGKIIKNAYGNVEIFKPTMVPENGYVVPVTHGTSMKMLETAARWILNIDYAKAIVSFEFGKAQKNKRAPTAKEGGILIDAQYKEAMMAVLDGLREQEEQERREAVEINALKSWNFFMKKLQIIKRLDLSHGKVPGTQNEVPYSKLEQKMTLEDENSEDYFSVGSDDEGSDNNVYTPRRSRRSVQLQPEHEYNNEDYGGGFLPAEGVNGETSDQFEAGGFLPGDPASSVVYPAGDHFVNKETNSHKEGGFFNESNNVETTGNFDQINTIEHNASGSTLGFDSNSKPDAEVKCEPVPKEKKRPRSLCLNTRHTRAAKLQNNEQQIPNTEVIDLDSDSETIMAPEVYGSIRQSRNLRSLNANKRRSSKHNSEGVWNTNDDSSTHIEEQELGIEYSDSS